MIEFNDTIGQPAQIVLLILSLRKLNQHIGIRFVLAVRFLLGHTHCLVTLLRQFSIQSTHVTVNMHCVIINFAPRIFKSVRHNAAIKSIPFRKNNNMVFLFSLSILMIPQLFW